MLLRHGDARGPRGGRPLAVPVQTLQDVRILGDVTPERLEVLRAADRIVLDEVKAAGLYPKIWQSFAVLLPVKAVGVMGDMRTYANVVALRAVESVVGGLR